ncbi:hypothetical protein [Bergeyella zoohelcum]|uniref:Uncharacterized protein n=2 Tax=Bergeyella zoohelcum TaxID=1015 RepID=A0A376BZ76_9FLAO|nr:hypothetical protein [Bergeyella zoohelcum]EKB60983.1 hypothetical protein HMPREF9700_00478 [Bergeyella zoohelcum CCUG 30536]SSZ46926.1 Uncharacterised protein [Bergeyella zoohelcum]VDH03681.1 Uncharacterised protein [Bergeyella zoohelcum]
MKTGLFFIIGFGLGFVVNRWIIGYGHIAIELFFSAVLGLAYALAYFVDRPEWKLSKKLLISLVGIIAVQVVGTLFFDSENTLLALIKFCVVFMSYNVVASLSQRKSLR